jgi:hypothetical protein
MMLTYRPPFHEFYMQYVAHKFSLKVATFTLSLVNFGKEVLKTSVSQLLATLENRPYSEGFRFDFIHMYSVLLFHHYCAM